MTPGTIHILNGGSSYGKTSLGQALQELMSEPTLRMGIDLFWFTLPAKQLDLDRVDPEYYRWEMTGESGGEEFVIHPGPLLTQLMKGRYEAIACFLNLGFHVISDDVIWERPWLEDTLRILTPFRVYFIGVYCDDRVSAQRERDRGDRHAGWARGSGHAAHKDAIYDLIADTSHDSPQACAAEIKAALDGGLQPNAFAEMTRRYL
jgi:chloramphenicol 3-O phosphotransferase